MTWPGDGERIQSWSKRAMIFLGRCMCTKSSRYGFHIKERWGGVRGLKEGVPSTASPSMLLVCKMNALGQCMYKINEVLCAFLN